MINYSIKNIESWNEEEIKKENENWLKTLRKKTSVYAIFTAPSNSNNFTVNYIGQTKSLIARARLTNHLIKKDKNTGAKLQAVKSHIKAGGKLKVSRIYVEPESLRHYIEEELIQKHSTNLLWNEQVKSVT